MKAAVAGLIAMAGIGAATAAGSVSWQELVARPRPAGAVRIAYGAGPLQHGDLWLPAGRGPHPVVVMVHGG